MHFVVSAVNFSLKIVSPFYANLTLTPWSRVLLEKPTATQLVKKFPAFYGTRTFITVFTKAGHLSLSIPCRHIPIPKDPF